MKLELELKHGSFDVNEGDVLSLPEFITIDFRSIFKGDKGERGERGEAGPQGPAGPEGNSGNNGQNGTDGTDGEDGKDGKDGTDNEFIFIRTTSNRRPNTPDTSQTDDYVPNGWTDNASGVNSIYQYEWTSKRRKVGGVWGGFSTPALWSKYSFDGADGQPGTPGADGADGADGVPGEKGEDGRQFYTWIRYSDYPDGTDMDNNPDRAYIGIAVNQSVQQEGDDKTVYKWSKTKGADGIPGEKGEDGKQLYTWVMYADTSTGEGISNDATDKMYIGFAYNKDTAVESTNPADYKWSLIRGKDGADIDDSAYQYLKEALKNGKTEVGVEGIDGVVLSNILGVVPPKQGAYVLYDLRAGMSGITDDGVAFFAHPVNAYMVAKNFFNGTSHERPKFAVNDQGKAIADDIDIGGGVIGGFSVSQGRIGAAGEKEDQSSGLILTDNFIRFKNSQYYLALGTGVMPSSSALSIAAIIEVNIPKSEYSSIDNTALFVRALGCKDIYEDMGKNIAIEAIGRVKISNSIGSQVALEVNGKIKTGGQYGMTVDWDSGKWGWAKFINGIFVGYH